jgi:endo-1,4-beta-xylanase
MTNCLIKIVKNVLRKNISIYQILILFLFSNGFVDAQLNTNGSFELSITDTVSGDDVPGWILQSAEGTNTLFEIIDVEVKEGNKSLRVSVDKTGQNPWDIQIVADSIPVIPGETYRYSVWAKSNGISRINFTVGNYSYSEYVGSINANFNNVSDKWNEHSFDFTITDNAEYIRAPIHFSLTPNVGDTIYIDHLRIINLDDLMKPVVLESEIGEIGRGFEIRSDGDIQYVRALSKIIDSSPGSADRIITFHITFPDSGFYDLFARVRLDSDDGGSFFVGNGFGTKDSQIDSLWLIYEDLDSSGFNDSADVVYGRGNLGLAIWKWVNISDIRTRSGESALFKVAGNNLTQIFQIGAHGDKIDIDKFIFGKSDLYFTVKNLENTEPGSPYLNEDTWNGPPLASKQPKFVGNIYSSSQILNFAYYWNMVIPENAGKWGNVEKLRGHIQWYYLDEAYRLAKDNGFPFGFHVLIWGNQQPDWINSLDKETQLAEITEWFEAIANRYPKIDFLQVVNEPLPDHNPPDGIEGEANYKDALGGDGDTGWDWVLNAFRMARDIFPNDTKLMINDYNILNNTSNTN